MFHHACAHSELNVFTIITQRITGQCTLSHFSHNKTLYNLVLFSSLLVYIWTFTFHTEAERLFKRRLSKLSGGKFCLMLKKKEASTFGNRPVHWKWHRLVPKMLLGGSVQHLIPCNYRKKILHLMQGLFILSDFSETGQSIQHLKFIQSSMWPFCHAAVWEGNTQLSDNNLL